MWYVLPLIEKYSRVISKDAVDAGEVADGGDRDVGDVGADPPVLGRSRTV